MNEQVMINLSNCCIFDQNAARLSDGLGTSVDKLVLVESFVKNGFRADMGLLVVRPLAPNEKKKAIEQRKTWIESLPVDGSWTIHFPEPTEQNEKNEQKVTVFAQDVKDLTQKTTFKPEYAIVAGNRRFDCLALVNTFLAEMKQDAMEFPAVVKSYSCEKERLLDVIFENENKSTGVLSMSWKDQVKAAEQMIAAGCSQNDLRKAFKDGLGQKLFSLITIANEFVARGAKSPIPEMLRKRGENEEPFAFGRIRAGQLREHLKSIEAAPSKKEEKNAIHAAESYIFNRNQSTKSNKPKVMDGKVFIETFGKSPIVVVRRLVEAFKNNDKSAMAPFAPYAEQLNKACNISEETLQPAEVE